jgi:hypothetical protein
LKSLTPFLEFAIYTEKMRHRELLYAAPKGK